MIDQTTAGKNYKLSSWRYRSDPKDILYALALQSMILSIIWPRYVGIPFASVKINPALIWQALVISAFPFILLALVAGALPILSFLIQFKSGSTGSESQSSIIRTDQWMQGKTYIEQPPVLAWGIGSDVFYAATRVGKVFTIDDSQSEPSADQRLSGNDFASRPGRFRGRHDIEIDPKIDKLQAGKTHCIWCFGTCRV